MTRDMSICCQFFDTFNLSCRLRRQIGSFLLARVFSPAKAGRRWGHRRYSFRGEADSPKIPSFGSLPVQSPLAQSYDEVFSPNRTILGH
jgi:hypothetical protein